MMNFSKENILEAIQILQSRSNVDKDKIEMADKFLRTAERHENVWKISIDILQEKNHDSDTCLFAAKILKQKMKFDFYQIQKNDAIFLFQNLIGNPLIQDIIIQHKTSKRSIKSYLGESLTIFYIQFYQNLPELTKIPKPEFTAPDMVENIVQILDVKYQLKQIPSSCSDDSIVVEEQQRQNYIQYLHETMEQQVFLFLNTLGQQKLSQDTLFDVINCFNSWIKFSNDQILFQNIYKTSIYPLAIGYLQDPEFCELSCEMLQNIIKKVKPTPDYLEINKILFTQTNIIVDLCIQNLQEGIIDDVNFQLEYINKYTKICPNYFLLTPQLDKFICMISNTEVDKDIMIQFYKIWHRFFQFLQEKSHQNSIDINQLHPHFYLFIEQCLIKSNQFSLHEENQTEIYQTEKEQIVAIRQIIGDLFCDLSYVVGINFLIEKVLIQIKKSFNELQRDQAQIEYWKSFESDIYFLDALIQDIIQEKYHEDSQNILFIFQTLELICQLNASYYQLIIRFLSLMKNCSSFLINKPQLIQIIFEYCGKCLQNPKLEKDSCKTLSQLCSNNKQFVIENIQSFFMLYEKLYQNDDYIIGLSNAIHSLQNEQYIIYLQKLCIPFMNRILQLKDETNKEEFIYNLKKLVLIIQRVKAVQPQDTFHPLQKIFEQLWPVIKIIMTKFNEDEDLIEESARVCKHTMRGIKHLFDPFLVDFLNFITQQFQIKPFGTYLYQAEITATVFGNSEKHQEILSKMLSFMCQKTLEVLNQQKFIDDQPNLVEDFFGMITRYLKYAKETTIKSLDDVLIETIFKLCTISIGIQHPHAAKSVYYFMEVISEIKENQKINSLFLQNYGQNFVVKLIQILLQDPERDIKYYIFDVFKGFLDHFGEPAILWFAFSIKDVKNIFRSHRTFLHKMKNKTLQYKSKTQSKENKRSKILAKGKNTKNRCKQSQLRQQQ